MDTFVMSYFENRSFQTCVIITFLKGAFCYIPICVHFYQKNRRWTWNPWYSIFSFSFDVIFLVLIKSWHLKNVPVHNILIYSREVIQSFQLYRLQKQGKKLHITRKCSRFTTITKLLSIIFFITSDTLINGLKEFPKRRVRDNQLQK